MRGDAPTCANYRGAMRIRRGRSGALAALAAALAMTATASAGPADIGFRGPPTGVSPQELTSSKPQSKLWFNGGGWWGSLYDPDSKHFHIFHLDRARETWTDTGVQADPRPKTRADTMWDAASG